jgi:hypothetical protein
MRQGSAQSTLATFFRRHVLQAAILTCAVLSAGCQTSSPTMTSSPTSHPTTESPTVTAQDLVEKAVASDPCLAMADDMDFFDCMANKPKCTFADAVRAVSSFIAGEPVADNLAGQYEWLLQRDVVRTRWHVALDDWVDRGTLSFMLYRAMRLRGGVNMAIFGENGLGDRRYAYHELRYRKLLGPGANYRYVSGPEMITLLGKVDEQMRETGRYAGEATLELKDYRIGDENIGHATPTDAKK